MKTKKLSIIITIMLLLTKAGIAQFSNIQTQVWNILCNGDSTGAIDLTVTGGTTPYTYNWGTANGSGLVPTDEDQTGLTPGTYIVTITDATSYSDTWTVDINEPNPLLLMNNNEDTMWQCSYYQPCAGFIFPSIEGGTYPYTYLWNTGDTTVDLNYLCEGYYSLTVTDAHGCPPLVLDTILTVLNFPELFIYFDTIINASNGVCNGLITINVTGGVPYDGTGIPGVFQYYLSTSTSTVSDDLDSVFTHTFTDLWGDDYIVNIQDIQCEYDTTFTILNLYSSPANFTDTVNITIDTCIFNQALPIDSAYISNFEIITSDSILMNWVFWQAGDSILLDVGLNTSGLGVYPLIYLNVVCNTKTYYTNKFYGRVDLTSVGVQNINNVEKISIYPNPANNNITIESTEAINNIEILDITGKNIQTYQGFQTLDMLNINITTLKKGIYFIRINNSNLLKFVKM